MNAGLKNVVSDVVFFSHDDLMVHLGVFTAMLHIYELDGSDIVNGMCSAETIQPPLGFRSNTGVSYQMSNFDRLKQKITKPWYKLESSLSPDSFLLHAREQYADFPIPGWLGGNNAAFVEWMTDFRISFRTNPIRRNGFGETLIQYALHEHTDGSFSNMRTHLIVGARNAQIYHHKMLGPRASGRRMGALNILNRAYFIAKYAEPRSSAIRHLRRYLRYKLEQYLMGVGSAYGRERLRGAIAAYGAISHILSARKEELSSACRHEMERIYETNVTRAII